MWHRSDAFAVHLENVHYKNLVFFVDSEHAFLSQGGGKNTNFTNFAKDRGFEEFLLVRGLAGEEVVNCWRGWGGGGGQDF